jgi:hypothetical protein
MSVLRDRLMSRGGTGPGFLPVGTAETLMEAPTQLVTYAGDTVLYGTAEPLVTADGAVIPGAADVTYPATVPAGRP